MSSRNSTKYAPNPIFLSHHSYMAPTSSRDHSSSTVRSSETTTSLPRRLGLSSTIAPCKHAVTKKCEDCWHPSVIMQCGLASSGMISYAVVQYNTIMYNRVCLGHCFHGTQHSQCLGPTVQNRGGGHDFAWA